MAVIIALDSAGTGQGELSAIQEIEQNEGLVVTSNITLEEMQSWLAGKAEYKQALADINVYRDQYGFLFEGASNRFSSMSRAHIWARTVLVALLLLSAY